MVAQMECRLYRASLRDRGASGLRDHAGGKSCWRPSMRGHARVQASDLPFRTCLRRDAGEGGSGS